MLSGFSAGSRRRIERPARARRRRQGIEPIVLDPFDASPCNHRRIVGAKPGWRDREPDAGFRSEPFDPRPQVLIGGDAASNHQRRRRGSPIAVKSERLAGSIAKNIADRLLERGGKVADLIRHQSPLGTDQMHHRRLKAGERKITAGAPDQRARQRESSRIAANGCCFQRWSPRVTQAQHFCHLVERLTDGVVDRRSEATVTSDPFDHQELAMTTRNEEHKIGERNLAE